MRSKRPTINDRRCPPHGFTLLELVIVIAITGILASMTFVTFSEQSKSDALKAAAREIAVTIRQAEAFTRSGVPKGLAFPKGGYGVQFDRSGRRYRFVWSPDGTQAAYAARTLAQAPWKNLPANVMFDTAPDQVVVFLPPKVVMARKPEGASAPWVCAMTPYRSAWCSGGPTCPTASCSVNLNQTTVSIRLKHTQMNVVQTVVIQPLSGKVSVE